MSARVRRSALTRTLRLVGPDLRPHLLMVAGGTLALMCEVVFRVLEPWPSLDRKSVV